MTGVQTCALPISQLGENRANSEGDLPPDCGQGLVRGGSESPRTSHVPFDAEGVHVNDLRILGIRVTAGPPALRNAIYAATGVALRRLPIDRDMLATMKKA